MKTGPLLALTGGSGFIGRHFADAARKKGYRIRHLGRRAPAAMIPGDEFRPLDLADVDAGAKLSAGCDVLVHLAAYIPRNHHDPAEAERCWRINAMGTLRLLEMAARDQVAHVVQAGSANAYAPADAPPDETSALFPSSRGYYLGSKILQEIYAEEFCRSAGMRLSTLRLASVYGPGQDSGALGAMSQAALAGGPVRVCGTGAFGSDMVLVDDVVQAILLVLDRNATGPFNVGSGTRTSIEQLAETLAELCQVQIQHDPTTGTTDLGFPALDIQRLNRLGYSPSPIDVGLRIMLDRQRSAASAA